MHVALRGDLRKPGEACSAAVSARSSPGRTRPPYSQAAGAWNWPLGGGSPAIRSPPALSSIACGDGTSGKLWCGRRVISAFSVRSRPIRTCSTGSRRISSKHGWSLKRLHRQIMLSATWQMSSRFDEAKFARDGDNRLLWRMNPRKVEVGGWRDTLLRVTGELERVDRWSAGRATSGRAARRTALCENQPNGRSRSESDAFLRLFDFPAPRSRQREQRVASTVPQQYLFMMNSPFMKERARVLGDRSVISQGESSEAKVAGAYRTPLFASPGAGRTRAGRGLAQANPAPERWRRYAQVLLSAHELIQIR